MIRQEMRTPSTTTPSRRRRHLHRRHPVVVPSSSFVANDVVIAIIVIVAIAAHHNRSNGDNDENGVTYRVRRLLLPSVASAQLYPEDDVTSDYYCGYDWTDANANCDYRCPSGLDADCPPSYSDGGYVVNRRCIASSGCRARLVDAYAAVMLSLTFDLGGRDDGGAVDSNYADDGTNDGANNNATGNETMMSTEDIELLEYALLDHLSRTMDQDQDQHIIIGRTMLISSVTVVDQRYDRPCVDAVIVIDGEEMQNDDDDDDGGGTSSAVTSLDMTIDVIGSYIPMNDDEDGADIVIDEVFGNLIANSINSNRDALVMTIKGNSTSSSSMSSAYFFDSLLGAYAIDVGGLAESPSSSPSSSPTRDYMQSFDMDIDSNPTGSYGVVFEVGTPRHGNTILVTSLSFVTLHTGKLEYEIYTKLGSFENYLGDYSSYDMIASGQVYGTGSGKYTRVLDNDTIVEDVNGTLSYLGFRPVYVPGDGGRRSFYVTTTKRFVADDGSAIPVLFSLPIDDNEGSYEYALVDGNAELEVYEGDGILEYPWPRVSGDAGGDDIYYRRPRGFFGAFEYDRVPCYPTMNFTGWPCPYAFAESSTSIEETTGDPIIAPSVAPSRNPTSAPSSFVGDGARDEIMNNSSTARNDGIEDEDNDPSNSSASTAMWIAHGSCILWIITHALSLFWGRY
jgi:hypothetical protein